LRQRLPGEAWRQALGDIPSWTTGKPSEAVALAARLPWRGVIASCLPEGWEKTLKNGRARRLDARMLAERDRVEDGVNPFLLQALGSFADPDSLCLSAADLRRRPGMEAVASFLRGLYAERSFVFIGFRPGRPGSAADPGSLAGRRPDAGGALLLLPDRALASESDLEAEILGAELDVVPVLYPGTLEELLTTWAGHPDGDITAPVEHGAVPSEERLEPLPQSGLVDWVREQHAHIESTPVAERGLLFERMGDVYRDRLKNPVQAISYYRSALQMDPGLRSVLLKLSELYTLHKHWAGAEEMLVKLAALEQSTEKRARLLCQAAAVALDELDRPVRAAQLLERALDEAPELPEIFDTLERLLNQEKNWQALARLYQKIARELDADGRGRVLKLRAMDGLAELALRFSKDPKVALKALEAADALDPHNADRKALMAQLYAQVGPGEVERAAAMHHAAIAADPDRFGSYRALADLYRSAGQRDRLWCVAATLSFLRKADEELREVYERGRVNRTGQVNQRFGSEVWARIAHPDEDRDFSALFAVLGPVLAGIQAVDGSALALRPEERATGAFVEAPVGRALANVSYVLDTPPLQVYLRPHERRPVLLRIVRTGNDLVPTLILGGPLVSKTDVGEAAFTLARSLVLLRPERIVCALESGRLVARLGMEAALNLAGLKPPSEAQRSDVERLTAELAALLPTPTRDQVVSGARRLIAKSGGAAPDVDRWCNAVELSAARAAFLMVNDLVLAAGRWRPRRARGNR
jgi:tetratricopeptide (TPR) repeat protein